MVIQVEVDQTLEEVLQAQARQRGIPVEQHAGNVLQEALMVDGGGKRRATQEEFRAFLKAMAFGSDGTRLATAETFDRESIYGDHA